VLPVFEKLAVFGMVGGRMRMRGMLWVVEGEGPR